MQRLTENGLYTPAEALLEQVRYSYGQVSNILNQDGVHRDYQYSYDSLYRLNASEKTAESGTGQDVPLYSEQFTYDGVANRLSHTKNTQSSETYDYNDANQLTCKENTYYHYDDNGQLISQGTDTTGASPDIRYHYDTRERLIKVTDGAGGIIAE